VIEIYRIDRKLNCNSSSGKDNKRKSRDVRIAWNMNSRKVQVVEKEMEVEAYQ
jgi:hypothetical protein